jgi:isopentenyl-diphosphate Delta-isomerase
VSAGAERVVLVDRSDTEIGTIEKLAGHRRGLLHRALSVVVRDDAGRFLLQKRDRGKYHSGGLWSNTCCSHPRPDEDVAVAAHRRLREEMGFDCPLSHCMTTYYYAPLDAGMIEHEIVHVFAGTYSGAVAPDPGEAEDFAWVEPDWLRADIAAQPHRYSVWFHKYVLEHWPALTASTTTGQLAKEDKPCVS